jgi:hypothetical protein
MRDAREAVVSLCAGSSPASLDQDPRIFGDEIIDAGSARQRAGTDHRFSMKDLTPSSQIAAAPPPWTGS